MSEITLTFYELQKSPELAEFWPANLPSHTHLAENIDSADFDFEDDVAEPIEDWAEDVFISQYIVQLDLQVFAKAGQKQSLLAGLHHGQLLQMSEVDFISQIGNDQVTSMINQLLGLSLSGWDLDEDLAKEESEIADLIAFLATAKMRGHSLIGVAVNS